MIEAARQRPVSSFNKPLISTTSTKITRIQTIDDCGIVVVYSLELPLFPQEKTIEMSEEGVHEEGGTTKGVLQRRHSDGIERLPEPVTRMHSVSQFMMNADDMDAMIDYYANEDKSSAKTWTRIFVEKYLQNVRSEMLEITRITLHRKVI